MSSHLPPSLRAVLARRGFKTPEQIETFLAPSLDQLAGPEAFSDMDRAVGRLRSAIASQEPITIYADRDVDGLSGLAILVRSLRTLGAKVWWGSPLKGRGVERAVLENLLRVEPKIMIFVDCGTGEVDELTWLASQGIDVIVADHHRMLLERPPAFAWIHPEASVPSPQPSPTRGEGETPCGCVMAFKLAQALWLSYLGISDAARLNYFLWDHLDLVALGILADRVPLTGENRTFVWHGLKRLAKTRKEGLASLMRFFRLEEPVSVRQATWQIIPLLNAAGRLGQPHWTATLLMTEDPFTAREAIDALLGLNTERRQAQKKSADHFEKTVLEQCIVETDSVLVATARGLEPSVTGLAAQSLVKKYGRPAFLFVEQGEDLVGSGRGTPEVDLFAWIEEHQDLLVKFGGHHGAVGLTLHKADFPMLREGLLKLGEKYLSQARAPEVVPEVALALEEADGSWWEALRTLEPFGPGFEMPVFELSGIQAILPRTKRSTTKVILKCGSFVWPAELEKNEGWRGPCSVIATPQATPKEDSPFQWLIQEVRPSHG